MPPNPAHRDTVMFLCKEDGEGRPEPGGTAFLVGFSGPAGIERRYFVTARHSVEDERPTSVRMRRWDGGVPEDLAVPEWTQHPTADVAVAPCNADPNIYVARYLEEAIFADRWAHDAPIISGDVAYFIGLLAAVETMRERVVPMIRAGWLGALSQEDIPMSIEGYSRTERRAHLLDSRSAGGFSGSPCLVDKPMIDESSGRPRISSWVALIGLIIAHFAGDATGIAVIVPIEAVREALEILQDS